MAASLHCQALTIVVKGVLEPHCFIQTRTFCYCKSLGHRLGTPKNRRHRIVNLHIDLHLHRKLCTPKLLRPRHYREAGVDSA